MSNHTRILDRSIVDPEFRRKAIAFLTKKVQASNEWTAQQIADQLEAAFSVSFRDYHIQAKVHSIGGDYVLVFFANVPRNSSQVTVANAKLKMTLEISSADRATHWKYGEPAPAQLKAGPSESTRRQAPKMRQVVGTPQQVVDAVIRWFNANAEKLKAPVI